MVELKRDAELEAKLLEAVIADSRERPRSLQRTVGPSEIGGCRALLRSKIFDDGSTDAPEEHWALAAFAGTVMGDALEDIFGKRLDAVTQQRITTHLEGLGVSISGAMDMIFVQDNMLVDLKSTAAIGSVQYEGPKLAYYIQVALYVWGAVQAGVLTEGATARIVYFDRTGNYQQFMAVIVEWDAICNFVELAEDRLRDVLAAQDALEAGDPSAAHALRDFTPSFCFSAKVECPQRFVCWGGSEWAPQEIITDPNHIAAMHRYVEGRRQEQVGKAMKDMAREELIGVEGTAEDGMMVGWNKNRISVVATKGGSE